MTEVRGQRAVRHKDRRIKSQKSDVRGQRGESRD
jgi:hypothetical protein